MAGPRQDMRRSLFASRSANPVTSPRAGVGGRVFLLAQKFHVDHGNWERVDRGIFRLPEWPPSPADSLIRWSLWARGKGVVSHDSALSAHEIGDANPAQVHLTVPTNFRARRPKAFGCIAASSRLAT